MSRTYHMGAASHLKLVPS